MPHTLWQPAIDILRGPDYWLVKMELAGVCPEKIEVCADNSTLIIRGRRHDTVLLQGFIYHSLEINYSRFERQIPLPFQVDSAHIPWEYRDGMLLIQVRSRSGSKAQSP